MSRTPFSAGNKYPLHYTSLIAWDDASSAMTRVLSLPCRYPVKASRTVRSLKYPDLGDTIDSGNGLCVPNRGKSKFHEWPRNQKRVLLR